MAIGLRGSVGHWDGERILKNLGNTVDRRLETVFTRDMNETHCTHRRQVRIADTNEWVCEDCFAAMDADDPTCVVSD